MLSSGDRVKFNISGSPGAGAVTVGPRFSNLFLLPAEAGLGAGDQPFYLIAEGTKIEWGRCTLGAGAASFTRDHVIASIDGGVAGTALLTFTSAAVVGFVEPTQGNAELNAIRTVTGATDTLRNDDAGGIVVYNAAGTTAVAATLPQAGAAHAFLSRWWVWVRNNGVGDVTITPTSSNINGASSLVLRRRETAFIYSDGTGYSAAVTQENLSAAAISAMRNANAVVNGGMSVGQELGLTGVFLVNAVSKYIVDCFDCYYKNAAPAAVAGQQVDTGSLGIRATGGLRLQASPAMTALVNDDACFMRTQIEGYRTASWQWGTGNASKLIVCFQLNSTVAGKAFVRLMNGTGTRNYYHEIDVAAGWNFYAFPVQGDTAGVWESTTGVGLAFYLYVAGKSATVASALDVWGTVSAQQTTANTNLLGTAGNAVILTNLFIGPANSDRLPTVNDLWQMMRPPTEELLLCLRYWRLLEKSTIGRWEGPLVFAFGTEFEVPMRTPPATSYKGTLNFRNYTLGGSGDLAVSAIGGSVTTKGGYVEPQGTFALTPAAGQFGQLNCTAGSGITLNARF